MAQDHPDESAASDDDVDDTEGKKFGFGDIVSEVPNADTAAATELVLNKREIASVESLEALKNLKKLELRDNRLTDLQFLEMNHALCWLALAKNRLRKLDHLQNMSALAVLDISDNRIQSLDGLSGLWGLKAFIAARNRIKRLDGLSPMQHPLLETLVVSNNMIEECTLRGFWKLRKLSMAHNRMHAFPKLAKLPELTELRLNANKIPLVDIAVAHLPKLSIFDIGNNIITELRGLEPLRGHIRLKSLNLSGNACVEGGVEAHEDVQSFIKSIPKLEILNNQRQDGGKKNKKGAGAAGAKDKQAAPAMAVHGRSFGGKKSTFADSDDEEPSQKKGADGGQKKKKKQKPEGGASEKRSTAEPTVAVHGRSFAGKKVSFADSDDDEVHSPRKGDAGEKAGKSKQKKRKKSAAARGSDEEGRTKKAKKTKKIKETTAAPVSAERKGSKKKKTQQEDRPKKKK